MTAEAETHLPDRHGSALALGDRVRLSLVLYAAVMGTYFAAGAVARPPAVDVETPLDRAIPFVPAAMLGYALAYVVPVSLLFVETTLAGIRRMTGAALLAYLIAAPFFVLMPVRAVDPPLDATTWIERLLVWNRMADTSSNAFPSMHVGLATLLALIGARRSRAWGWGLGIVAFVIACSTLLVKQHFLVDLPAGAIVGWCAFRVIYGKERAT